MCITLSLWNVWRPILWYYIWSIIINILYAFWSRLLIMFDSYISIWFFWSSLSITNNVKKSFTMSKIYFIYFEAMFWNAYKVKICIYFSRIKTLTITKLFFICTAKLLLYSQFCLIIIHLNQFPFVRICLLEFDYFPSFLF